MDGEILTGDVIRLSPVRPDEAGAWQKGERSERAPWFGVPLPSGLTAAHEAIASWEASWRDLGPVRHWGIRPLDADELLGGVQVADVGDGERAVRLTFLVFPAFRHRGIAVEASRLALDYAMRELGATHAIISTGRHDAAAGAVARRLGATYVGTDPDDPTRTHLVTRLDLNLAR